MNINCAELLEYVLKKFRMPLNVAASVIREGNMTDDEILNWHIPELRSGGGSMQPRIAVSLEPDEKTTLADVLKKEDRFELKQMLGDNWIYEFNVLRGKPYITVYRASIFPIIPGSYVTESRQYALFHREYVNAPEYHIYSLNVPQSSLMWLGDTHEFVYTPTIREWKEIAHRRLERFPDEIRKQIMQCAGH